MWATRADYLPTPLEPRELHTLLSPGKQQGESSRDDSVTPQTPPLSRGDRGRGGERVEATDSLEQRDLENGIREALIRGGLSSPATNLAKKPYKGRPLQGAWATAGQTGALVVSKQGGHESRPPVEFSIMSPGSSSGFSTPSRDEIPNPQVGQTPPPPSQATNWNTPLSNDDHRRGNRGAFRHSQSGPERGYEQSSPSMAPRRFNSEQCPGNDQSRYRNQSHDRSDQSHVNNWNIHMKRSPDRCGDRGRGRGRGRGRRRGHSREEYHHNSDQYQRSHSDVIRSPQSRGRGSGKPYSEPLVRDRHRRQ